MNRARLETVKEESVECWIFPNSSKAKDDASYMNNFLAEVRETVLHLTKNYLWHKDCFDIHLPVTSNDEVTPHLYSLTCYGDNIEDEWFIVYVLTEITKRHPESAVQVRDNDGEFLLIEAAAALPLWAKPDTTHNRVFIFNGDVHLITPVLIDIKKTPSVNDALECLNTNTNATKAKDDIQQAIRKRIQIYPENITLNLHRSKVRMPLKFAALLKLEPALIAQVVNAYCNRDTVESNICKRMELENCIDTSVTFTKCLYAMLIHSSIINKPSWRLPAKSSNDYKKCMLGVKLACGFEILMSKGSQETFVSKQWHTYLENLQKNCYFKGNIEGSKEYTNLLEAAKVYYLSNECSNINAHIGNSIKQIMTNAQYEEVCKNIAQTAGTDDDSDDWLNINPEELNDMMSERYGSVNTFCKGDNITPQAITKHLSSFLKQSSDLEGIEVDKGNEEDETSNANEDCIQFDYEQFTAKVKDILDSLGSDDDLKLDSDTESSEYGSDNEVTSRMGQKDHYQQAMDEELSSSTIAQSFLKDVSNNTFVNILQSVTEEKGSSGPSSNLLANIGLSKSSIQPLDSDDDDDLEA